MNVPADKDSQRPSPEEVLARVQRDEDRLSHGRLKVFLGFAAGVGKTFEMLSEANRRKLRGQDVVVGFVETHGRQATADQIGGLEVVPRRRIEYRGAVFEEMDTDAVLRRQPTIALVDELAHTNVPGSEREKRWQDVEVLLRQGIGVLTTMNVQHLESLNDTVYEITGVRVRETVPDSVLHEAYEIVLVDITPEALINRLERGDVYPREKVAQARANFFRPGNLGALREIAMREAAQRVDEDVASYRRQRHIEATWATHDRIMVCISPTQPSARLLRRGWRTAQRLKGEVVAIYVERTTTSDREQAILREDFALADRLGIPTVTLHGDVATELVRYARANNITQVVIGHSDRSRLREMLRGSIVNTLIRELRSIDVLVVANAAPEG
jgi:two-component system sensor histidine kinase KdpD